MAWGLFRKIKQGLKKAGTWLKEKALPAVKQVAQYAAPAIDTFVPGVGTAIRNGIDIADNVLNGSRIKLK